MPSHVSSRLGFVIALPEQLADGARVIVSFDGYEQAAQLLEAVPASGAPSALAGLLIHSGYALRELAVELHAERMIQWIDGASSARRSASRALVVVESALAIAGRSLLVIGWAAVPSGDIRTAKLRSAERVIDVTSSLVRVQRPGLFQQFPYLAPHALGFVFLVDDADVATAAEAVFELETAQGNQSVRFSPEVAGWAEFVPQLKDCPNLAEPLFAVLDQSKAISSLPGYAEDVAWLRREGVAALSRALPRSVHNALTTVAAIDRVVSFAGGGLLVVGWHHEPQSRLNSAQILCADGSAIDVLDRMFPMPRRDVYEALVQQFPSVAKTAGSSCSCPVCRVKASAARFVSN